MTDSSPTIRLGSRRSRLALAQTHEIARALEMAHLGLKVVVETFGSAGDRSPGAPIGALGGKGAFTGELEAALLDGRIDAAVHSLKDLPVEDTPGLAIGALPPRADARDVMIYTHPRRYQTLPQGAVIGTSSARRAAQLLAINRSWHITELRGNVPTRLEKLRALGLDAIVLAAAGLERLGIEPAHREYLPLDVMVPAPGQGALAVQIRADNARVRALLAPLHDRDTEVRTTAERSFLRALGLGCLASAAAHAVLKKGMLELHVRYFPIAGGPAGESFIEGAPENAAALGEHAAAIARAGYSTFVTMPVAPLIPPPAPPSSALANRLMLVTRDEDIDGPLSLALRDHSAEVLCVPFVGQTVAPDDTALRLAVRTPPEWLVLTSSRALQALVPALAREGLTLADFPAKIAAVGRATARAIEALGRQVDVVPEEESVEGLLRALVPRLAIRTHILYPRAARTEGRLAERLREAGMFVADPIAYSTQVVLDVNMLQLLLGDRTPDVIVFASASAASALLCVEDEPIQRMLRSAVRASIGPRTTDALRDANLPPHVEAPDRSFAAIADALARHFASGPRSQP